MARWVPQHGLPAEILTGMLVHLQAELVVAGRLRSHHGKREVTRNTVLQH